MNLESHLILLQVSKKTDLAVYIGWENYPLSKKGGYDQMLGDLPDANLDELFTSRYRFGYFREAKNFLYDVDSDKIVYH